MGQFWIIANLDKEQFIELGPFHPSKLGEAYWGNCEDTLAKVLCKPRPVSDVFSCIEDLRKDLPEVRYRFNQ